MNLGSQESPVIRKHTIQNSSTTASNLNRKFIGTAGNKERTSNLSFNKDSKATGKNSAR